MKIKVSENHIQNGVSQRVDRCPIALAVRKSFPTAVIAVDEDEIVVDNQTYKNDEDIAHWIDSFDNFDEMDPIEIELDTSNQSARLIERG